MILTINSGSSSLKFALYRVAAEPQRLLHGQIGRLGHEDAAMRCCSAAGEVLEQRSLPHADHPAAAELMLDWLTQHGSLTTVQIAVHRVVHGMQHSQPERLTPALLDELRSYTAHAPDHLPQAIGLMERVAQRRAQLPQLVCFDTAFHRSMPAVARRLALPRRYTEQGLQRYGFHGLSCEYLMYRLQQLEDSAARQGRVILAHLGNGASMTAVRDGQSVDTTMAFTPAAGLVMSTRVGDIDPGLPGYFARHARMDAEQFHRMVNFESGLLGVSGHSGDMRELLAREDHDAQAAEAVELFCYQARKALGALTAVLGGLDTLVFSGGIGEHAPTVRARMCAGLGYLGLDLDPARNARADDLISTDTSGVRVRVLATDEEQMLARHAATALTR